MSAKEIPPICEAQVDPARFPWLKATPPAEAGLDPAQVDRAFELLAAAVQAGDLPGAVAVILRRGVLVAHRSIGWAQLLPEGRAMLPGTPFDLASLTKVMATLPAVLLLLERGAFRLDDPLATFIPDFTGEGREEVCIRHLLTHTAGLQPWIPLEQMPGTRAERIGQVIRAPLQERPGTRVIYSDLSFILLGALVERLTGRPLDQFVRDEIYAPLGFPTACFNPPDAMRPRCAATEYREYLGRHQVGEVHDERATSLGGVAGHAGLFATAMEVAAYGQLWLQGGTLGGVRLLSPATVTAATRLQTPGMADGRGLGWIVLRPDDQRMSCGDLFTPGSFGHTGFTGTSLWVDPARELVVALLTNRVHLGRQEQILRLRPRFHNAIASAIC